MGPPLLALVVVVYLAAIALLWFDRSIRPLLLLAAGSIATLAQPLWTRLFGTSPDVSGNLVRIGDNFTVPLATVLAGGVLLALPPLFIIYGMRHQWWGRHYAAAWSFFIAFVLFFLIVDGLQDRAELSLFAQPELPREGTVETVFQAMLLSGISFGLLYTFVSTRHYALQIALVPLLLSGLAIALLMLGILCSPYWVARLLKQPDRVLSLGAVVSVVLVLWAIHLLARGLHDARHQRLQWR